MFYPWGYLNLTAWEGRVSWKGDIGWAYSHKWLT